MMTKWSSWEMGIRVSCPSAKQENLSLHSIDSQSWFHSQEVNVMIDSKVCTLFIELFERYSLTARQQICAEMMDSLLSNQNTMQYGLVSTDGKWRDAAGKTLEDYGLTEKGAFRGLSAIKRIIKEM